MPSARRPGPRPRLALPCLALLALAAPARAQEAGAPSSPALTLDWGVDLVSRYVWRGLPIGNHANVQPYASLAAGPFTVGAWSSFADDYLELDLSAGWSRALPAGTLSLSLQDYYSHYPDEPDAELDYFNFRGVRDGEARGRHTLEVAVGFEGPERLPFSLLLAANVWNDPGNSVYLEAGYARTLLGIEWGAVAGLALNRSDYYGADAGEATNLGLSAARAFPLARGPAVEVGAAVVHNPAVDHTFYVLRLGL